MTEIRMNSPEKFVKKEVDDNGRLYLGQEFGGKKVALAIAIEEEDEEQSEENEA